MYKAMVEQKQKERKFLEQLLDGKKVENYTIPVPIKAELRKYQQVGCYRKTAERKPLFMLELWTSDLCLKWCIERCATRVACLPSKVAHSLPKLTIIYRFEGWGNSWHKVQFKLQHLENGTIWFHESRDKIRPLKTIFLPSFLFADYVTRSKITV